MAAALTETAIWMALRTAFASFAGQVPVAWPAETYEPDPRQRFYAVGFTAAPPRRILVGPGAHVRDGFLTVSHVAPVGQPQAWHLQKAAEIAAAFPADRLLASCVRITRAPAVQATYLDGPFLRTPVVIPWQAFA